MWLPSASATPTPSPRLLAQIRMTAGGFHCLLLHSGCSVDSSNGLGVPPPTAWHLTSDGTQLVSTPLRHSVPQHGSSSVLAPGLYRCQALLGPRAALREGHSDHPCPTSLLQPPTIPCSRSIPNQMLVDQLSGNNLSPLSLGCSGKTTKCPGPRGLYPSAQRKHLVTGL